MDECSICKYRKPCENLNYLDVANTCSDLRKFVKEIRADAIEEFAHALKETFNNEFPSNYHCTQPYFTLDNVRVLIDCVVKEQK